MIFSKRFIFIALLCFFFLSCSPQNSDQAGPSFALPTGWYVPPESGLALENQPNATLASGVTSIFQTNVASIGPKTKADSSSWSLGAVTASFGVSSSGIFGILTDSGSISVTATWQDQTSSASVEQPQQSSAVAVTATMTTEQMDAQLEPAIQAAVASGRITNESQFRSNLRAQGENFLGVCQALSTLPAPGAWGVKSFQLQASFSASGELMIGPGIGAAVRVSFAWRSAGEPTGTPSTPIGQSLNQLVQALTDEIPVAISESSALTGSGFSLSQINVGIGISASGDVGIADVGGSVTATLTLGPTNNSHAPMSASPFVNLLDTQPSSPRMNMAVRTGVAFDRVTLVNGQSAVLYHIPKDNFRGGLEDAIKMSVYFAGLAKSMDSDGWSLSKISASFSTSINGVMTFPTVDVHGQMGLSFSSLKQGVSAAQVQSEVGGNTSGGLSQFFTQEIGAVAGSLASISAPSDSTMTLQDVGVDISASIKYGIPGIANISLSPDVDFIFGPVQASN